MPWFTILLIALSIPPLFLTGFAIFAWWLKRSYHEPDASDEIHFVKTDDGARLALYRYRARGETRRNEPVFFCHGLGASKHNFDFDDTYSWARSFAKAGYDAWVVDLRGAGMSTPPGKWDWSFDDYARHDVSACIQHIRSVCQSAKVHWIGHSMGGMLLYAYLGSIHPEWVRSGVTMGSPVRFFERRGVSGLLKTVWLLDYVKIVPIRAFIHMAIPILGWVRNHSATKAQMNPANVDVNFIKRVAYNAVHHLPYSLLKQFSDWAANDCFRSLDKKVDYQAAVSKIDVPVLVMAGAGDRLVVAENVKKAYEMLPENGKNRYMEMGRSSGCREDYGHIDLVFGRNANEEVLPIVLEWVNEHDKAIATTDTADKLPA